jgi:uncharacterized membrane protein YphA (DoxX/SURF4 family)
MMNLRSPGFRKFAVLLTRFGLATAYLSAVADRFGIWGHHGAPGVAWGDFQHFIAYTETLNPLAPKAIVPVIAWFSTLLELGFGVTLLIGVRTRAAAFGSGCLLLAFALAMSFSSVGVHSALAYSVFSAAGASMLLASVADNA